MAVDNQERLQHFLLKAGEFWSEPSADLRKGRTRARLPAAPAVTKPRWLYTPIQANAEIRSATFWNTEKTKGDCKIWNGFSWTACWEQNSAFSFLRAAHSSAEKLSGQAEEENFWEVSSGEKKEQL